MAAAAAVVPPLVQPPNMGPIPIALQASIQNIKNNYNDIFVGYSPILLTFSIIIITAFSQTTQGLTFIGFFLLWSFIRVLFLQLQSKVVSTPSTTNKCVNFKYIQAFDNDGFSIFYITYLYGYLIGPMIIPLIPMNTILITVLGAYMLYIIIYSISSGCIHIGYVIFNIFYGIGAVAATIAIVRASKIESELFLQVGLSDAVKCSMPSKQSFKCSVYKNGELQSNPSTVIS
jgi:hypothetical protein